jgi:hypothetical protein
MKLSPDEMAHRLGRHRSTIFRELRRNHVRDSDIPKLSGYWYVVAQSSSDGRRTWQRKLVRDPGLHDQVEHCLKSGWTPEQIAGRMRYENAAPGSARRRYTNTSIPRKVAGLSCGATCPPAAGIAGTIGCASARRRNLRRNSASCSARTS